MKFIINKTSILNHEQINLINKPRKILTRNTQIISCKQITNNLVTNTLKLFK